MPNVSIKYVFWGRGGKRRHGGIATEPVPDEMLTNGKAQVLFWSVVGAAGGPIVSFAQGIPSFSVGTIDIIATAFCIAGDGLPQDLAYIDAFNIDTGLFLDDDFVSIYKDKDETEASKDQFLSTQANDDGTVPTKKPEFVLADILVPKEGFQYWKVFGGSVTSKNIELKTTPESKGAIAFAFYQQPKKPTIPSIDVVTLGPIIIGRTPDGGIIVLGPHGIIVIHPGGPDPGPELGHILAAAQQYALSAQLSPEFRKEALDLVSKQLASSSRAVLKQEKVSTIKSNK